MAAILNPLFTIRTHGYGVKVLYKLIKLQPYHSFIFLRPTNCVRQLRISFPYLRCASKFPFKIRLSNNRRIPHLDQFILLLHRHHILDCETMQRIQPNSLIFFVRRRITTGADHDQANLAHGMEKVPYPIKGRELHVIGGRGLFHRKWTGGRLHDRP